MKISELLERLDAIQGEFGDVDVLIFDDMGPRHDGMNSDFAVDAMLTADAVEAHVTPSGS